MPLRFLALAAALLALAACDGPSRPKAATVSVPVAAANCPPAPALACTPATPAKANNGAVHHIRAVGRPAARQLARATPRRYGKADRHAAPEREYARVPPSEADYDARRQHEAYVEQRARGYARGDDYAGAERYSDRREFHGERGHRSGHAEHGYAERGYAERDEGSAERSESYSSRSSEGGYVERGYSEGYFEQGGGRYVERRDGPCDCGPPQAAGRDRYGFLTWPGKVPARP